MKFSSFSSVLNFHCMSTQKVPRANNDPYIQVYMRCSLINDKNMNINNIHQLDERNKPYLVEWLLDEYFLHRKLVCYSNNFRNII